jgi:glycosyltransferase involved in cell wall biosynthesis
MEPRKKLIRITTVPISLKVLLRRQLKFMSAYFDIVAVSSPGQALEEVGRQEEVRTSPVAMTRSVTPLQDIKAVWRLYRLLKKEQPQIVHTHTPKAGLLGMMAARMAGIPIRLHTVAGMPLMENKGLKRKILECTEWLTYRWATKVYPNSRNLAEFILQNNFCKAGKIKVLGNGSSNGIDMEYFQPTPEIIKTACRLKDNYGLTKDHFVFVFIGRLVKDKGIEELVQAFTALKQQHNNIKLLLVGPYEQELDPLSPHVLETIKNDADIIQVDFQHDVRPYLAMSDALAFPTYREGFPNVPMQAGCFHLPSIVTDINGCNEIIVHEKNGLIIPVKNSVALKKAMETLLVNSTLYLNLKANARQMILERYEQNYFWKLLLNEYNDQLQSHGVVS